MIFLCSVPTGAGAVDVASFEGMVTRDYLEADFDEREDGTRKMSEESARRVFFHDCEPETSRWAAAQLRWQGPRPLLEAAPFREWPDVPMDVILTRDDRSVDSAWAMAEAARWLNGRAPILLPGGHSPFLSHPRLLAETLVRGARGN